MGTQRNYKNTPLIIEHVSLNDLAFISISELDRQQIERKKRSLVEQHVENAISELQFTKNDASRQLCRSRLFFVEHNKKLVLCGVYKISEAYFPIGPTQKRYNQVCDYVLYSKSSGFYRVFGCTSPNNTKHDTLNISPSIYYQENTNEPFKLLNYGNTYSYNELANIRIKYNFRYYTSLEEYFYNIFIINNTTTVQAIKGAPLYFEIPMEPDFFLYSSEKDHMGWLVPSTVVDFIHHKKYPLCCHIDYNFHYDYSTTLSCLMVRLYNDKLRISDNKNYYFYISKTETVAYDVIKRIVSQFGQMQQIDNLLDYDSTINYKLTIPKYTSPDIVNFIFGVIMKSKTLYPAILGCPIHDIIEILCNDCKNNPYSLPQHPTDAISANNALLLIKQKYGNLTNWNIVKLITARYGFYASETRYNKYWVYYHTEKLDAEYLPTSVGSFLGETINGRFVNKLDKQTIKSKWTSEYSLYKIVYCYYPDAVMHYSPDWLGRQHLDIFIPCIHIAIEYHGLQHYEANDFFGGEEGFIERLELDERKKTLCIENSIKLIEWPYSIPITSANLIVLLKQNGAKAIPIPDLWREPPVDKPPASGDKPQFSIRQYNFDGNLLKSYSSYKEAAEATGSSSFAITKAATGNSKTAGGYQWRRVLESEPKENIDPLKRGVNTGLSKPVLQVTRDGEVIAEYPSISQAEKTTGINKRSISSVLNGTQKTAGNYYWVYKEG